MQVESAEGRFARTSVATVLVFVTLAGAVAGLTLLFLGMRAVMDVGGACADGGPYVSAQPCPEGAPLAILGGIWGGLACFALYVWQTFRYGVPGLWALGWSALFLSLGWNFLEYGLDAPGPAGMEWGWLLCAVVFGLMGGVPLVLGGRLLLASVTPFGRREAAPARRAAPAFARRASFTAYQPPAPTPEPAAASDDDGTLVAALERLAALRAAGALSAEEFAAAKRRILEDGP